MPYPEPPRDDRPDGLDHAQDLLRTSDVARMFQVSTRTVSEWARRGRIPCMRTPGGQWRYPADAIRALVQSSERPSWYEHDRPEPSAGGSPSTPAPEEG